MISYLSKVKRSIDPSNSSPRAVYISTCRKAIYLSLTPRLPPYAAIIDETNKHYPQSSAPLFPPLPAPRSSKQPIKKKKCLYISIAILTKGRENDSNVSSSRSTATRLDAWIAEFVYGIFNQRELFTAQSIPTQQRLATGCVSTIASCLYSHCPSQAIIA